MRICITIGGVKHCLTIPLLVEWHPKFPPNNFPELELAATILEMTSGVLKHSELSKQLSDVATRFVENLQKQLPKDVEIVMEKSAGR